jgi:hypothetical protein
VTQSTGQTSVLHDLAVKVSGHIAPMLTVGLSTLRVRDAVPPSQETEHAAQLDQAPIMQSTASIDGENDGTVVGAGVGEVGLKTNSQPLNTSNCPDDFAWRRIVAPRQRR